MNSINQYYSLSGKSSLLGFSSAVGMGIVLIAPVAFVYNLLITFMPIVYINFLFTTAFGVALGYFSKFLGRLGKIRNKKHSLLLTVIFGLLGSFFQWVGNFTYLISEHYTFEKYVSNIIFFSDPIPFFSLMKELGDVGSWSMFGAMIKDFPLWITWIIEALIIIGLPILITVKHPIIPFSEILNRWYRKYTIKNEFESISLQAWFNNELINDPEKAIDGLTYGSFNRFAKISVFYLKGEESQYLSVDNIFLESRGKGKANITPVTHLLRIDTPVALRLMEKYTVKKQFILDY